MALTITTSSTKIASDAISVCSVPLSQVPPLAAALASIIGPPPSGSTAVGADDGEGTAVGSKDTESAGHEQAAVGTRVGSAGQVGAAVPDTGATVDGGSVGCTTGGMLVIGLDDDVGVARMHTVRDPVTC